MSRIPNGRRIGHQRKERPHYQYHEDTRAPTKVAHSNDQNQAKSFQNWCTDYFPVQQRIMDHHENQCRQNWFFSRDAASQVIGVRWPKIIRNIELYEKTGVEKRSSIVKRRGLSWLGHLLRLDEETTAKEALSEYLCNLEQKCGTRKTCWIHIIKNDLQHLETKDEKKLAQHLNVLNGDRKYYFSILLWTFINFIMMDWICASALCFNNCKRKDSNSKRLKYYCLPRENSEIQS